MVYLFISIFCSVFVGVLFKYIKAKTSVNIFLITINYLVAIVATYVGFQPDISWNPVVYSHITILLSVLLPLVFIIFSLSVEHAGIIKTDIAQRISLVIPIAASWWLFHESISLFKWLGLLAGLLSIFLIIGKSRSDRGRKSIYLLLVFAGYGIVDVLFKQLALSTAAPFTTGLFYIFTGSFIFSLFITLRGFYKKKLRVEKKAVFYGILLGVLNFSNIYFYLKAHQSFARNPTTVFASMNFGVIIFATIIGALYFNEKLSRKNFAGLALAVIAILVVAIAQMKGW